MAFLEFIFAGMLRFKQGKVSDFGVSYFEGPIDFLLELIQSCIGMAWCVAVPSWGIPQCLHALRVIAPHEDPRQKHCFCARQSRTVRWCSVLMYLDLLHEGRSLVMVVLNPSTRT